MSEPTLRRWSIPTVAALRVPALTAAAAAESATEVDDDLRVVTQTRVIQIGYTGYEPQLLEAHGCVRELVVDEYYGEFELLDPDGASLGTSHHSVLALTKPALATPAARTWSLALERTSPLHQRLTQEFHCEHPGLDFQLLQPVRLRFLAASPTATEFPWIPVLVRVTNVWDPVRRTLLL